MSKNPFAPAEIIYGCPTCKQIENYRTACDVRGCWAVDTCGTPTKMGYRRTCYKHRPKEAR